ncbi:MAG: hypothetical protein IJD38_12350 [Clostridia bacterium]|nr:hypothetical protein [Clostridia bacterium]
MKKTSKIVYFATAIILLSLFLLLLPACSGAEHTVQLLDGSYLEYQGVTYVRARFSAASSDEEGQMELDRYINFPFSKHMLYHSYGADAPVYIAEGYSLDRFSRIYFREDYDLTVQTYILDDTDTEFVFSEVFSPVAWDETIAEAGEYEMLSIRLQDHPEIRLHIDLRCVDGIWYMHNFAEMWTVSEDFVEILTEAGLIGAEPAPTGDSFEGKA